MSYFWVFDVATELTSALTLHYLLNMPVEMFWVHQQTSLLRSLAVSSSINQFSVFASVSITAFFFLIKQTASQSDHHFTFQHWATVASRLKEHVVCSVIKVLASLICEEQFILILVMQSWKSAQIPPEKRNNEDQCQQKCHAILPLVNTKHLYNPQCNQ